MAVQNRGRKRGLTKGTSNVVPEHRETWFLYEGESYWKSDRTSDEKFVLVSSCKPCHSSEDAVSSAS